MKTRSIDVIDQEKNLKLVYLKTTNLSNVILECLKANGFKSQVILKSIF